MLQRGSAATASGYTLRASTLVPLLRPDRSLLFDAPLPFAITQTAFSYSNFSCRTAGGAACLLGADEVVPQNPPNPGALALGAFVRGLSGAIAALALHLFVIDLDDSDLEASAIAFATGGCVSKISISIAIRTKQSALLFAKDPSLALAFVALFAVRGFRLAATTARLAKLLV